MTIRTKIAIVSIVLFLLFIALTIYILYKPYYLVVNYINIVGNSYLTRSQVIALSGIIEGESLVLLPTSNVEELLLESPWIRSVEVEKSWPDRVSIIIEERRPMLALEYNGTFALLDHDSICLDINANFAALNLPILSGRTPETVRAGSRAFSAEEWQKFSTIVEEIPQTIWIQLSEVSWYNEKVSLYLRNGLELYLGSIDNFKLDKLSLVPEVLLNLDPDKKGYLDLSGIYIVFRSLQ